MSRIALFIAALAVLTVPFGTFAQAPAGSPPGQGLPEARRVPPGSPEFPPENGGPPPQFDQERSHPGGPPGRGGGSMEEDLRAIRRELDQQSKQIEALAREIAQLNLRLTADSRTAAAEPAATAAHAEPAPPPRPAEPAGPVGERGAASPAPPHEGVEPPKAEAVSGGIPSAPLPVPPGGTQHPIAKGETLTSIAKQYNISVAELLKANQIHDERKLQIGQILNIPPAKPPQPSTDKKEKHNG